MASLATKAGNKIRLGTAMKDIGGAYVFFLDIRYRPQDHLGSTRAVESEGGTQSSYTELINYDAYGAKTLNTLTGNENPAKEKFTGKEYDSAGVVLAGDAGMGLTYFGARYYDPEVGIWTSTDPLNQYWNPYAYSNNPTLFIDPNGQGFLNVLVSIVATVAVNVIGVVEVVYTGGACGDFGAVWFDDDWKNNECLVGWKGPLGYHDYTKDGNTVDANVGVSFDIPDYSKKGDGSPPPSQGSSSNAGSKSTNTGNEFPSYYQEVPTNSDLSSIAGQLLDYSKDQGGLFEGWTWIYKDPSTAFYHSGAFQGKDFADRSSKFKVCNEISAISSNWIRVGVMHGHAGGSPWISNGSTNTGDNDVSYLRNNLLTGSWFPDQGDPARRVGSIMVADPKYVSGYTAVNDATFIQMNLGYQYWYMKR